MYIYFLGLFKYRSRNLKTKKKKNYYPDWRSFIPLVQADIRMWTWLLSNNDEVGAGNPGLVNNHRRVIHSYVTIQAHVFRKDWRMSAALDLSAVTSKLMKTVLVQYITEVFYYWLKLHFFINQSNSDFKMLSIVSNFEVPGSGKWVEIYLTTTCLK